MGLNLDAFTTEVNAQSIAKPNLFIVEIGRLSPKVMQEAGMLLNSRSPEIKGSWPNANKIKEMSTTEQGSNKLSLYVRSINIAGTKIEKTEVNSDRVSYDRPTESQYNELSIEFMCDSSFNQKHYFTQWMQQVVNPYDNTHGYYNDFVTNIVIKTFGLPTQQQQAIQIPTEGKVGGRPYIIQNVVEYTECWPTSIEDISLQYGPKNELVVFKVNFTYRVKYEAAYTTSDFSADLNETLDAIQSGLDAFGITGFNGIVDFIGSTANKANSLVNTFINKPLNTIANVRDTISNTVYKVKQPIAGVKSGGISAGAVVPGAKNLLNVLKR